MLPPLFLEVEPHHRVSSTSPLTPNPAPSSDLYASAFSDRTANDVRSIGDVVKLLALFGVYLREEVPMRAPRVFGEIMSTEQIATSCPQSLGLELHSVVQIHP